MNNETKGILMMLPMTIAFVLYFRYMYVYNYEGFIIMITVLFGGITLIVSVMLFALGLSKLIEK